MASSEPIDTGTLKLLHQLTLRLGTTLDLEHEIKVFIDWLAEICNPSMVAFFLVDGPHERLYLVHSVGFSLSSYQSLPLGIDPWVWLAERGISVPNEDDPRRLAFPISLEGALLGLICVASTSPPGETWKIELLNLALAYLAPILRNIQRYQLVEEQMKERTSKLRRSEKQYRDLIEMMNEGLMQVDKDDVILFVNPKCCEMLGYSEEELVGEVAHKLLLAEEDQKVVLEKNRLRLAGISDSYEIRFWHKAGHPVWMHVSGAPLYDDDGNVIGSVGLLKDITEHKRQEAERQQLTSDLERRNQTMLVINEIGRKLSASLDLQEIYWIMHREIGLKLLNSPHFVVARFDHEREMFYCDFAIVDGETVDPAEFPPMPFGEGPMSDAIRTRQPLIADLNPLRAELERKGRLVQIGDERQTQSGLYIPLIGGNEIIGVLSLQSYEPDAYEQADLDLVVPLASQASVAIQNARLFQGTQQMAERWRVLHSAVQKIVTVAHDPEQVYQAAHQAAQQLFQAGAFVIALHDKEQDVIRAVYLFDQGGRWPERSIPAGRGLSGKVIASGQSVLISDFRAEEDPYDSEHFGSEEHVRSLIAVPMWRGEEVVGMISAQSYEPHAYASEDLQPLEMLAAHTAVALENARLFAQLTARLAQLQRAESALKRQLEELTILQALTRLAVEAQSEDELLEGVTKLIGENIYPDHFGVLLVDEPAQVLRVHPAYHGISGEILDITVPLGEGISGRVAATGQAIRLGDVRKEENYIATTPGIRSEICVPIKIGSRVLGVINAESTRINAFTADDERLLTTLASVVATGLQNVRLFEEARRREAQAQALLSTSQAIAMLDLESVLQAIAEHAKSLFAANGSRIHLIDADGKHLTCVVALHPGAETALSYKLRIGDGLTGYVAVSGEAEIVPNTHEDPRGLQIPGTSEEAEALMLAPLKNRGEVIGVMSISRSLQQKPFLPTELDFLTAFAAQASAAIANARLYEETRQRVEELEILRQLSLQLTAIHELETVLIAIVKSALHLVKADDTHIFLYDGKTLQFGAAYTPAGPMDAPHTDPRPDGITYTVARSGERVVVPNTTTHPLFADYNWEGAIIGLPLKVREQVVGVMNVAYESPHDFNEHELRALSLLAEQAALAIANASLIGESQRRAREMGALAQALQSLNTSLQTQTLLENILQAARQAIPAAEKGSLLLLEDDGLLHIRASIGYQDERIEDFAFPTSWGFAGRAVQQREPVLITNVQEDPSLQQDNLNVEIPEVRSIRSSIVAPLMVKGTVIGAMALDNASRTGAFEQDDLDLLTSFANQAAAAIQNARLYEETLQRLAELEAVSRVSTALRAAETLEEMTPILLQETLNVLNSQAGGIVLYDPSTGSLKQVVAQGWCADLNEMMPHSIEGIIGYVYSSGKTYHVKDIRSDPRVFKAARQHLPAHWSGVVVPIRSVQEVIGVLYVFVPASRQFSKQEVRILNVLAEIAGNAIHRSQLHEQTEQRLRYLTALRAVDHAITSSLDVRVTLQILLEQLTAQLGVDAADVLLLDPYLQTLEYAGGSGIRNPTIIRTVLRLNEDLMEKIVLQRQFLYIPDLAQHQGSRRAQILATDGFTSYLGIPLITKGEVKGVLELLYIPPCKIDPELRNFISAVADQAAIAIENAQLFDSLQRSNMELKIAYDSTLEGWAKALELRDRETEGHSKRVTEMTVQLARAMGMTEEELLHVRRGAILHDIGKMGIPDEILHKEGNLTDEEEKIMQQHPRFAFEMLLPIQFLRPALDIPYYHHEKWDGTGYPEGLKGEQIPLAARIFAVVDVFDALTSDRPYRPAWPKEKALAYIHEQAGKHFDPEVVKHFLKLVHTYPV